VNLLNRLDMNVIATAHGKIEYDKDMKRIGSTFDAWKRWPYMFDLIIELERRGNERVAIVRGTRIPSFADGEVFPWSYAEFQQRYPQIDQESQPVVLANAEQIAELNHLLSVVILPPDQTDKWLAKAGVETFDDMSADQVAKCIAFVKAKLENGDKK
jgi:hypothetical protein